ncbi:GCN5 family N-acetyltransferase [Halopseudomonas oceani]|uniref:GNAT family N-acetyltransferase n=1 Tax=Halopseudomonas oceani TaxID=1708783 RepID=A0A2P4ES90_9GAMM|nr:GNAT family protein [Halopseudomonas oceani]POB01858.1 GNAT family N-acetyltransferase [Halopseudomonas oceani]GGE54529.1 GCN5 family N-acetyltransferase [Halopseudomonas oceani]
MTDWLQAVALETELALLRPLHADDADALVAAASDGRLWELWYTQVPDADSVASYVAEALREQQLGRALPFVVVERASGQVVGTTRYCHADAANRRLEIGYTWYASRCQRTALNTQCKLALLQQAFEVLGCVAVEFRTHWHNHQSRAAIARLGAKQDGVLRNHRLEPDGARRDTVVFSILDSEWPSVRKSLLHRLARHVER